MAIAASGSVSFSDLRSEFVGGSAAVSYSDLYRGGSNIRTKAANNTGVNLAASVPASGIINFTNFRSQAKGFRFTYTTTSTDQDADTLFGSDYSVNYPKEIVINSSVTIGGVSDDALDIPSTLAGTLVINNNGSIIGFGGASAGAAGGSAINCAVSGVTINNTGLLAGGGGAGNVGGAGGNGSYTTSNYTAWYGNSSYMWFGSSAKYIKWANSLVTGNVGNNTTSYGIYQRGSQWRADYPSEGQNAYQVRRLESSTSSSSGGSGGSFGVGAGYNQSATNGGSGASGGQNAGSGGAGSNGATYGLAASNGSTGANGNASNGSAGASGGAAGAAVTGTSVTMNNTGTLHGAVA